MSKKEIILEEKEVWEIVDFAIKLAPHKWGIPASAYNLRFELEQGIIRLVLTETKASDTDLDTAQPSEPRHLSKASPPPLQEQKEQENNE